MNRLHTLPAIVAGAVGLLVTGCGGGGRHDDSTTNGTTFVQGLVTSSSDTAEPVSLDGKTFTFSEDPNAFDALFQ